MKPMHPIVEALVSRLSENLRELFEERAGILQFEAGVSREAAEPLALLDVLRMHPLAVAGVVCVRTTAAGHSVIVIATTATSADGSTAALGSPSATPVDLAVAVASLGGAARLTPLKPAVGKREKPRI